MIEQSKCFVCNPCECRKCQLDRVDAMRYRELRAMIGPLQVIIGPQMGVEAHLPTRCTPDQLRNDLDSELDRRIIAANKAAP